MKIERKGKAKLPGTNAKVAQRKYSLLKSYTEDLGAEKIFLLIPVSLLLKTV